MCIVVVGSFGLTVFCLSLRTWRVGADPEVGAALPVGYTESAGCGSDNAAPCKGGLQECLHHLQHCNPAEEQSQSQLTTHSTSTGSLPGGMQNRHFESTCRSWKQTLWGMSLNLLQKEKLWKFRSVVSVSSSKRNLIKENRLTCIHNDK